MISILRFLFGSRRPCLHAQVPVSQEHDDAPVVPRGSYGLLLRMLPASIRLIAMGLVFSGMAPVFANATQKPLTFAPYACETEQHGTIAAEVAYLDVPTLGQPEAFIHNKEGLFDPSGDIGAGSQKFLQAWMDRYVAWVKKHAG